MTGPRKITVLGATGSVGESTLDLIGRAPGDYDVIAVTGGSNAKRLAELAVRHKARNAAIADPSQYTTLKSLLSGTAIEVSAGDEAVCEAAALPSDWVMAAIVGAAGMRPTFAAVAEGRCIALANKECLVSAGNVFLSRVKEAGALLCPVDSEHSGVFQAIDASSPHCIEAITLTASGGPFREWSAERLMAATPDQALKHPNWSMGRKITIDSATLMNKGLELIEAFHLFPVKEDQLRVLVHPQSVVHCLVHYCDGAVLAQMAAPDMRTPIAYSLAYPERIYAPTERLDLTRVGQLTFQEPDEVRFPSLRVAREALRAGGTVPTILNAANEIAVERFLAGQIGFMTIPKVVEAAIEASISEIGVACAATLDEVIEIDKAARLLAERFCGEWRYSA